MTELLSRGNLDAIFIHNTVKAFQAFTELNAQIVRFIFVTSLPKKSLNCWTVCDVSNSKNHKRKLGFNPV